MYIWTINAHYSWILYFWVFLLIKFICNPKSQYLQLIGSHSWTSRESLKIWIILYTSSYLRSNNTMLSLPILALILQMCPFHRLFIATFFTFFFTFLLVILLFEFSSKCFFFFSGRIIFYFLGGIFYFISLSSSLNCNQLLFPQQMWFERLSRVPECKKAARCLMEIIHKYMC